MEIVVAVGILAVLAAIFIFTGTGESKGDRERYDAVADALYDLTQSIVGNEPTRAQTSFRWVIGVYPGKLSDLTTPITTTGKNICGAAYLNPGNTAKWLEPFWNRVLLPAGTILASGLTVQDTLVRLTAVPTPGFNLAGTFAMRFPSVTLADAQGMDLAVDGALSGTAGTIRYAATDPTTMDYYVLISGC
jgi:hypothetical protein